MSSTNQHVFIAFIINFVQCIFGNPLALHSSSFSHFQTHRTMQNLPCVVLRSGMEGVCMFAIHCLKANGTHLGTCRDGYYFKSCCQLHDEPTVIDQEIIDNSIDQNTISHYQPSQEISSNNLNSNDVPYLPFNSILSDKTNLVEGTSTVSSSTGNSGLVIKNSSPLFNFISSISYTTNTEPSLIKNETSQMMPSTREDNILSTLLTTTENMKLQTFQSVQSEPTTTKVPILITTKSTVLQSKPTTIKTTIRPKPTNSINKITTNQNNKSTTRKPPKTKPTNFTRRPIISANLTKPVNLTKRPTTQELTKPPTTKEPNVTTPIHIDEIYKLTTFSTISLETTTISNFDIEKQSDALKPSHFTTFASTRTTTEPLITVSFVETTKIPRPKPKPTSHIISVPPTNLEYLIEEQSETSPSLQITSTTTPETTSIITHSTTLSNSVTQNSTISLEISVPKSNDTELTEKNKLPIEIEIVTLSNKNDVGTLIELNSIIEKNDSMSTVPDLVTWSNFVEHDKSNNTESDWILISNVPDATPQYTSVPAFSDSATTGYESTTENLFSSQEYTSVSIETDEETKSPFETTSSTIEISTMSSLATLAATEKPSPIFTITDSGSATENINVNSTTELTQNQSQTLLVTNMDDITTKSTQFVSPSTQSPPIIFPNETAKPIVDNGFNNNISVNVNDNIMTTNLTTITTTPVSIAPTLSTLPSLEGVDYRQVCGKRMFPEPRIVGGSKAAFGRWPWQISLRQWRTSTYLHKCGAALLNENWAITAAHCVDNVPPSDLLLRLGEYDLAEEEEPYNYQERRVQIVASHPQFDPRTFEYDLALLRFYEPVEFQPNIIPVCVPSTDENFIGRTAYVTGWGRLYEDGPLPSVLQEVSVPVINNSICETMYRNAGYIEHIPHIFICAGWRKGGYDSCEGDSGGPMVIQREDKRFLLAGVISWGIGCAEPNQPGVYTRISEFRDWINQILQF